MWASSGKSAYFAVRSINKVFYYALIDIALLSNKAPSVCLRLIILAAICMLVFCFSNSLTRSLFVTNFPTPRSTLIEPCELEQSRADLGDFAPLKQQPSSQPASEQNATTTCEGHLYAKSRANRAAMGITRDLFAPICQSAKWLALTKQLLSMQLSELVIASIWLELDSERETDRDRDRRWVGMRLTRERRLIENWRANLACSIGQA